MWVQGTIKELKGDREAREMAFYLMTSPSSNLLGLYYLPLCTLRHELGYDDDEQVRVVMRRLISKHFLRYDEASETIWVINMCREQVGDDPKATDNRIRGVLKEIRKYKKNPFYGAFCEHYSRVFGVTFEAPREPLGSPSGAPCKGLTSPSEGQKNPGEAPPESGSGTGTGTGRESGAGAPATSTPPVPTSVERSRAKLDTLLDVAVSLEAAREGAWTAQAQREAFQGAYERSQRTTPAMGGRQVGSFHGEVLRTAELQGRDPGELFAEALSAWLARGLSETERRAPYACFQAAWGDLTAKGVKKPPDGSGGPPAAPREYSRDELKPRLAPKGSA